VTEVKFKVVSKIHAMPVTFGASNFAGHASFFFFTNLEASFNNIEESIGSLFYSA
jgi:hypothetical protein